MHNNRFRSRVAVSAILWGLAVLGSVLPLPAASTAQLTFYMLTAPHAALGAQMQSRLAVTNTGGASLSGLTPKLILTASSGTMYTVFSTSVTNLAAGNTAKWSPVFITRNYTSQTGAFTLTARLTDSTGMVLGEQSIPLTVVPVPANGVYVSAGGQGPDSGPLGTTTDYGTVTANLTAASMTLTTNTTITRPDGTTKVLQNGTATAIAANTSKIVPMRPFNTADFDAQTGTFIITANALGSDGSLLATDTYSFMRTAIPATKYVPSFTNMAAAAMVNMPRMHMSMNMSACFANASGDYMAGGSGVSVADFNGDGWDDMYMVEMMGMGHLYMNMRNGTFEDMAMMAGIPMVMDQSGATAADIDNDGYPDLLILTNNMMGTSFSRLFHNNGPNAMGDVTFTDITAAAGLPTFPQNFISGAFGDYDGDGFVDLYLAAHVDCTGGNNNDHLLRNNGNNTFTDVTYLLVSSAVPNPLNRRGMAAAFVDYNGDGRQDLYVGNDEGNRWGGDVLWRNDGFGTFTDVSSTSGAGVKIANMGFAFLDYLRTGAINIFDTSYGANALLRYRPATASFERMDDDDVTHAHVARGYVPNPTAGATGLTQPITWGAQAYDYNNDGWEDLFEAGGFLGMPPGASPMNNAVFLNNQDGTFLNVSPLTGVTGYMTSMPAAVGADFNNDGFFDVFVASMMDSPQLFINNARSNGNPYNWLEVKLVGKCTPAGGCTGVASNKGGIGARLVASVGGVNMTRWVVDGAAYQGNNTLVQHFGLGTATVVDSLTINWPSGKVQTLSNVAVNQKLVVQEP